MPIVPNADNRSVTSSFSGSLPDTEEKELLLNGISRSISESSGSERLQAVVSSYRNEFSGSSGEDNEAIVYDFRCRSRENEIISRTNVPQGGEVVYPQANCSQNIFDDLRDVEEDQYSSNENPHDFFDSIPPDAEGCWDENGCPIGEQEQKQLRLFIPHPTDPHPEILQGKKIIWYPLDSAVPSQHVAEEVSDPVFELESVEAVFTPSSPGSGVGEVCLPVDIMDFLYLMEKSGYDDTQFHSNYVIKITTNALTQDERLFLACSDWVAHKASQTAEPSNSINYEDPVFLDIYLSPDRDMDPDLSSIDLGYTPRATETPLPSSDVPDDCFVIYRPFVMNTWENFDTDDVIDHVKADISFDGLKPKTGDKYELVPRGELDVDYPWFIKTGVKRVNLYAGVRTIFRDVLEQRAGFSELMKFYQDSHGQNDPEAMSDIGLMTATDLGDVSDSESSCWDTDIDTSKLHLSSFRTARVDLASLVSADPQLTSASIAQVQQADAIIRHIPIGLDLPEAQRLYLQFEESALESNLLSEVAIAYGREQLSAEITPTHLILASFVGVLLNHTNASAAEVRLALKNAIAKSPRSSS